MIFFYTMTFLLNPLTLYFVMMHLKVKPMLAMVLALLVIYSALKNRASNTRRLSPLFSSFLTLLCHAQDSLSLAAT